jgi:hypothetical protein
MISWRYSAGPVMADCQQFQDDSWGPVYLEGKDRDTGCSVTLEITQSEWRSIVGSWMHALGAHPGADLEGET